MVRRLPFSPGSAHVTDVNSDFDTIGGEPVLRAVIDTFVDRVFDDLMIGFHFRNAKRKRIKRFEYEHAAEFLGAPVRYEGRSLAQAHAAHRIMGGHFDRRTQILREVLAHHEIREDIAQRWLRYVESLRSEITRDARGQCVGSPSLRTR